MLKMMFHLPVSFFNFLKFFQDPGCLENAIFLLFLVVFFYSVLFLLHVFFLEQNDCNLLF